MIPKDEVIGYTPRLLLYLEPGSNKLTEIDHFYTLTWADGTEVIILCQPKVKSC